MIFLSIQSYGQLNVKEKTNDKVLIGEGKLYGIKYMDITYYNSHEKYLFMFKDMTYQHIYESGSFWLNDQSFNELYELILQNINSKEKKEFDIDIDDEKLTLRFEKKRCSFWVWDGYNWSYSVGFNKNQILKLFGKE
jgi:hypothetical protein